MDNQFYSNFINITNFFLCISAIYDPQILGFNNDKFVS